LEIRSPLEIQDDTRETIIELFSVDYAVSIGRIVRQVAVAQDAFEHEKMIELPEYDHGHLQVMELIRFLPPSLGLEPVTARRARNIGAVAAVPIDCARFAQLLQRDPSSEKRKHNTQGDRAAFGLLLLQHQGRTRAASPHPFERR